MTRSKSCVYIYMCTYMYIHIRHTNTYNGVGQQVCRFVSSHVSMCVTWLIFTCEITGLRVLRNSFPRMRYVSFSCMTWLTSMCHTTHFYLRHDSRQVLAVLAAVLYIHIYIYINIYIYTYICTSIYMYEYTWKNYHMFSCTWYDSFALVKWLTPDSRGEGWGTIWIYIYSYICI